MLEELELTVCALGEHRCAERLHDLLDGDILVGELIPGRAVARGSKSVTMCRVRWNGRADIPNETKSSHTNRLEIGVSVRKISQYCNRGMAEELRKAW
jgi:hypothetical protein